MLDTLLKKVFGSKNDRELKRLHPLVDEINQLESRIETLSDSDLRAQTGAFRQRLEQGESLDELLPEAFATVREAGKRQLNMRHFDVQLLGGMVLHEGNIAEMKTGEGKTLVATLPVYLNALAGRGVHVVTVNDYLARRDAEWMSPIYQSLGLTVGSIQHDMDDAARHHVYRQDITYGTNNEYGFDYLRDNMKFHNEELVQRPLFYAIVDEVDSILIDEARTPLIISGPSEESTDKYYRANRIIPRFKLDEHYTLEEKTKSCAFNEEGVAKAEELLNIENLYDPANIDILHHLSQALKAHVLFKKDVDYVVKDGEVIIVDEFTGRLMPGRRYSDGLHQALEAKEGIKVANENQTLASITFQNFFRMYDKLAGMTGTADTEASEFHEIYKLDVMVMPTNRELIRIEYPDVIYRTEAEKFNAVVDEIIELHRAGRPVLVGTISIEKSELLGTYLKRRGIPHDVLNAKNHEREAEIVAQAGRKGAVTISTNMAGRGTDILLGGNAEFMARKTCKLGVDDPAYPEALAKAKAKCDAEHEEVVALGGLHILATERHEARRIDNQLRGRSGRQGDPGSSRFYLSLEDDLLRIFGSERISGIMEKLGMEEGQPIEHSMITKSIEGAQRKVEAHNFDIRKHLLEYDDVMNKQREVIYDRRREVLDAEDIGAMIQEMHGDVLDEIFETHIPPEAYADDWDLEGLKEGLRQQYGVNLEITPEQVESLSREALIEQVSAALDAYYADKKQGIDPEEYQGFERWVTLQVIDKHWKDHLLAMDHLKEGIGLRGYGQKNPLNEYKREGFDMFEDMIGRINTDVVDLLFKAQPQRNVEETISQRRQRPQRAMAHRGAMEQPGGAMGGAEADVQTAQPVRRQGEKIGRNAPCPCGSGKKYKRCCGA